jgi:hypothetical protein
MTGTLETVVVVASLVIIAMAFILEVAKAKKNNLSMRDWAHKYPARAATFIIIIAILVATMNSDGGARAYTILPANFTPPPPHGWENITIAINNAAKKAGGLP